MSKNRIRTPEAPSTAIDLRRQQIMCKKLADSMRGAAVELQLQVSGQVAIEGEGVRLIVLFSCFPNGDILVWFLDQGYFSLMALVNQNFKHIATFPAGQAEQFQAELDKLKLELGK